MREIGRVGKGSGALDLRKSTVFVDNLPNGIRKGFLYNLYSRFGKIRDCYIPGKKSKRTGQSFGFIRFESISDAAQAVEVTNRYWIWGRELFVNVAKFLKKQGASPTQIYNQYKQKNLEGEDGSRNQRDYNNQHPNFNSQANNGNAIGNGKEVVIYQQNDRIQRSAQKLKGLEKRGEEEWRRKVVPEYSNQGGVGRSRFQEGEVKDGRKTIKVQAVGNGWLSRSAVGKVRRLISAQDLVSLFTKEKLGSIQIKPMGGRYMVITFPSEARRNEVLKEKWLDLWFEEVKPWNGEAAKDERFVWIACYGMPLDAWNIPSFRAIGSSWGCFIEVDSDTLREISFTKGRILIATENPNKIEGEVQLVVNGREYNVRVEEEDTFRTVPSTNLVSNSEVNSEEEEEDDEVGRVDDEVDASKTMKQNSVDDMENQGNESLDDRAKINEEEVEKGETNDINGSHKDELEKEPAHEESYAQRKSGGGKHIENFASCENINEESHTSHGLVSIVQDSQSPIVEECVESVQKNFQVLNAEPKLGDNQDQEKGVKEANNSGAYESDVSLRASQLPEINLHIDLNPSAARKNIRSQQLETSLSTDGDDIDEYIMGFQEQEHDAIEKEMQNTLAAGNTLGIKFDKSGILRMKKMIENESIAMKASIKNNSFAPLLRDY